MRLVLSIATALMLTASASAQGVVATGDQQLNVHVGPISVGIEASGTLGLGLSAPPSLSDQSTSGDVAGTPAGAATATSASTVATGTIASGCAVADRPAGTLPITSVSVQTIEGCSTQDAVSAAMAGRTPALSATLERHGYGLDDLLWLNVAEDGGVTLFVRPR